VVVEPTLFDEVADVVRGFVGPAFGELHLRPRRYGLKVWFGGETPTREHYEAQVLGPQHVEEAKVLALEIGFHAENPKVAENEAVMARLLAEEGTWRSVLGEEAVAGTFLGRGDVWRRLSETWPDPDLGGHDLAIEVGVRLGEYITALEPLRRHRVKEVPSGSGKG
jgi:hypothetical protein